MAGILHPQQRWQQDSKWDTDNRTQQQDNAKCFGTEQVKEHVSSCSILPAFIQILRSAPVIDQARLLPWVSDKSGVTVPRRDLYMLGGYARSYGEQRQCSSHSYQWCVTQAKQHDVKVVVKVVIGSVLFMMFFNIDPSAYRWFKRYWARMITEM